MKKRLLSISKMKLTLIACLSTFFLVTVVGFFTTLVMVKYDKLDLASLTIVIKRIHFGYPLVIGIFVGLITEFAAFSDSSKRIIPGHKKVTPVLFIISFVILFLFFIAGAFIKFEIALYAFLLFTSGNITTWTAYFIVDFLQKKKVRNISEGDWMANTGGETKLRKV